MQPAGLLAGESVIEGSFVRVSSLLLCTVSRRSLSGNKSCDPMVSSNCVSNSIQNSAEYDLQQMLHI